jgi:hypothetical protein
MNKREDFRARMFGLECAIHNHIHSAISEIENISGTGAAIDLAYDFFNNKITLEFEIGEKFFKRESEIIFKKSLESGKVRYHVKFINYTEREREELHSSLVTYEASRNADNN